MIDRLLGTPNEDTWPGVTSLPDYKPTFPNWHTKVLEDHVPGSNSKSIELIEVRAVLFVGFCVSGRFY